MQETKKKIHPNVLLLGSASLLNDLSSEMITPILPLLITQLGGAGIAIGLIGGLRDGFANILQIFTGYLSDKLHKRKIFIYAGYAISGFFKIFLAIANSWFIILGLVGLERVGKALRTAPRDALISLSSQHNKGYNFGVHRMLDTMGAILGSLVAFLMLWHWNLSFQTIVISAAIVAFFSLLPLIWVQETPLPSVIEKTKEKVSFSHLPPAFRVFIIIASVFSLADLSYMFFILRTQEVLPNVTPVTPISLYILFNITYTIVSAPLGALSDKIGYWRLLIIGYFLFACVTLGFMVAQTITMYISLFILYGITTAIIKINHKAFAAHLSPETVRATAMGTFETTTGLMVLVSGAIVGSLWQFAGASTAFCYTSFIALVACTMLILFKKDLGSVEFSP